MEDLDGHHPVHLRLLGLVDGPHAARSDLLQNPILPADNFPADERICWSDHARFYQTSVPATRFPLPDGLEP
jgi:hypothetical protein